ncbi:hypothetical protein PFISCL1PPCAC_7317, partial [Pristionchus fissidentatus]
IHFRPIAVWFLVQQRIETLWRISLDLRLSYLLLFSSELPSLFVTATPGRPQLLLLRHQSQEILAARLANFINSRID